MVIKFSQTEKWQDEWFHGLTLTQKALFMYFCDKSDCAGYVKKNGELFSYETGITEVKFDRELKALARSIAGAEMGLGWSIEGASKGLQFKGYWIRNHVRHQRNLPLNPTNKAHWGILKRLWEIGCEYPEARSLIPKEIIDALDPEKNTQAPCKPLDRGTSISISTGIGIERDEGSGEKGEGDDAHRKLSEHPALRGLTWEMSVLARRNWPHGNYLATADQIITQAVLNAPITKPGAWLQRQYARLASGISLERGDFARPIEKKSTVKIHPGVRGPEAPAPEGRV